MEAVPWWSFEKRGDRPEGSSRKALGSLDQAERADRRARRGLVERWRAPAGAPARARPHHVPPRGDEAPPERGARPARRGNAPSGRPPRARPGRGPQRSGHRARGARPARRGGGRSGGPSAQARLSRCPQQPGERPRAAGPARGGGGQLSAGHPPQARFRRGPLQPGASCWRGGPARGGRGQLSAGHPAQARLSRGPQQPGARPGEAGPARGGRGQLSAGHPAPARLARGPQQPGARPGGARGELEEAAASYQQALQLKPEYAEAHNNLGSPCEAGRLDGGGGQLQQAIRLKPEYAEAHNNLGIVLGEQDGWRRRWPAFSGPSSSSPTSPRPTTTWGSCSPSKGGWRRRWPAISGPSSSSPTIAEAHRNLGMAWLLDGPVRAGMARIRMALEVQRIPSPLVLRQPPWDGSPLGGRTILLHAEQGLGDTLQFIRYAPAGRTARRPCDRGLPPAVAPAPGQLPRHRRRLVAAGRPAPGVRRPRPADEPAGAVRDHPGDASRPRSPTCPPTRACRAAGASSSAPSAVSRSASPGRAIPSIGMIASAPSRLVRFAPLAASGRPADQPAEGPGQRPVRRGRRTASPSSTWAASSDDFLGHRRGPEEPRPGHHRPTRRSPTWPGRWGCRCGWPCPRAPDWRWLLEREDSPWYPTMRLFRQARPGDWEGVFQRMAEVLEGGWHRRLSRGRSRSDCARGADRQDHDPRDQERAGHRRRQTSPRRPRVSRAGGSP